ncbi:MAG TPA: flagellar hook-length control protein FliK [Noviherbaspirillum sp.]|jgi:flagellar hook-length control protein FliK|uniref:flagellar hook-length control protein FliK n=1 Tax=Noviherbaspirillum sp. TaxID=1926288 RepID=UPI002DDD9B40|nr:flagellar hook-length control protein FliK [Noviherbaspirillum sp.]HEV2609775.1 flagellar hook-length control protein FliK [Noviherbaspirillum sp.]
MQTPPIINPVNVASSPAPVKQADKNGGESSFGQTLSREIAGRNSAAETPKPVKENKPTATAKAAKEKQTEKAAEKSTAPSKSDTASATDAAKTGSEHKDVKEVKDVKVSLSLKDIKDAKKAKLEDTGISTASTASDNMLALVAGAGQIISAATPAKLDAEPQPDDITGAPSDNASLPAIIAAAVQAAPMAMATDRRPSIDAAKLPADAATQPDAALGKTAAMKPEILADAARHAGEKPAMESRNGTDTGAQAFAQELAAATSAAPATASPSTDVAAKMQEVLPGLTGAAPATMQPIQQQALQGVQTAGPQSEKLTPPVGSPAWDQALGQKVVWMVAGEQQSASLTLNPPDLGPLQVVLNVSNSQANATFISAQPEVRQALEAAMPKLREMLGEAGIQLGQSSVNAGTPNQHGNFADQHAPASRHDGRLTAGGDTSAPATARVIPATLRQGLVDTFA